MSDVFPLYDVFVSINEYIKAHMSPSYNAGELWEVLSSDEVAENPEHREFFRSKLEELKAIGWFSNVSKHYPNSDERLHPQLAEIIIPALVAVGVDPPDCLMENQTVQIAEE
ncbi:MAG: hypothetical protein ACKKL4_02285 [Patescibacteria group bacterium]